MPAQHKARPSGALQGSLFVKGRLTGRECLPFREGEPPLGGGGVHNWNLFLSVVDSRSNPSVTFGASSPTGEPFFVKGILLT